MTAPPLLSAPAHHRPPLGAIRPLGPTGVISEARIRMRLTGLRIKHRHEVCFLRVSASLACRASYTSMRRDHVFFDSLPRRCQPVDLLRALDRILDASKQRASTAQKSLERWKVSRKGRGPWTGHDLQAIRARCLRAPCVPLAPSWAKPGDTQRNSTARMEEENPHVRLAWVSENAVIGIAVQAADRDRGA